MSRLSEILNKHAPDMRYALMAAPDGQLPELQNLANRYLLSPENLTDEALDKAVQQAAAIASHYFDANIEDLEKRAAKAAKRHALFCESAGKDDGTMLFFHDGEQVRGYARVLPVSAKEFTSYIERYDPPESGFHICDPKKLESGEAVLFVQALVLPALAGVRLRDKLILQEAAIMRLLAGFLDKDSVQKGVKIHATAFHPYTDKIAQRLGAKTIGENPHGHKIYGVEVGPNALEHSFGRQLYRRVTGGFKPLSLTGPSTEPVF